MCISRASRATASSCKVARSPARSSSAADPTWRNVFVSIRLTVRRMSSPSREILPFTTMVAPNCRRAVPGSVTFKRLISLVGTTHNDCSPTSRLVSLLLKLSINPSDTASLAGLPPTFSNESTAMCSWCFPNTAAIRSLIAGMNKSKPNSAATATKLPSHHIEFFARDVGGGHRLRDACSTVSR